MSFFIIGSGGHAKVLLSALQAAGRTVDAILDDNPDKLGQIILGVEVIGSAVDFSGKGHDAVIAVGDNRARERIATSLSFGWQNILHPHSWVDPTVTLGEGSFVCAGAVVQPLVSVGRHAILNTSCSIDHDCQIGDFCHVAPGVHLAGSVIIETGVFLGIGSSVIPGKRVCAWSVVGAGGVVIRDVPPGITVAGCPAWPI